MKRMFILFALLIAISSISICQSKGPKGPHGGHKTHPTPVIRIYPIRIIEITPTDWKPFFQTEDFDYYYKENNKNHIVTQENKNRELACDLK